ncbi:MAG: hypothetical protein NTZ10_02000 [Candidatus Saganbacteria bacterium]|nr:hypothetical protein [Candidatus Saganbacteria bacterium]
MNREPKCGDSLSGALLADQIKSVYPEKTPAEIAEKLGLKVIFERPVNMGGVKRISEYRPKTKEIAVFYSEKKDEAVAHELFHYFEMANALRPGRNKISESEASIFAKNLIQ